WCECMCVFFVFFFFQAEDGIRDKLVTGVQTCALPISGVEALYQRIHSAAKRVCSESGTLQQTAAGACARKAEADAIEKVSLSQLTAYFRMKTGNHTQPLAANR